MQVLSRRGIASYLRCKNELGFMASSVKALVRDLKGVDTVFISYCFYAIVLQPYNKGSSYPTEACNPTHPKTAMSRYSLQLFSSNPAPLLAVLWLIRDLLPEHSVQPSSPDPSYLLGQHIPNPVACAKTSDGEVPGLVPGVAPGLWNEEELLLHQGSSSRLARPCAGTQGPAPSHTWERDTWVILCES